MWVRVLSFSGRAGLVRWVVDDHGLVVEALTILMGELTGAGQ
jgi:hypothetical protein